ncbi:SusC/RagA family TonB-linked outer membrane protein [Pontibacter toksunensis]|uniref:SusC/RagA family TonB-linked outer membrane protein n=1 Tax=Pontibacter toksunensis TaxID=1332631 RepID=A0ABW6BPA6_9BACT
MMKNLLLLMMCLLSVNLLFAQSTITVQGKVTDATSGQPLIGAGVAVQGTTTGTQTDAEGNFTLAAPPEGTLVISYLGYNDKQVPINNNTSLNVQLAVNQQQLEEVVVVGYGVQEKRDITGSISSVEGEEIARQASQNPVSAMQGKVAGVQITNSGAPGASPQVRIRGTGSAYGKVEPLYVVDGTFVDDLNFLNPADIESIEVLKDASSAAIYGVRAANGVVLVTTKRGTAGQMRVNYNGFVGVQRVTNQLEMANARQYATLLNERSELNNIDPNTPSTDWFEQILRTAKIHNHQVSVSGGSEKATYSASAGYLNQEGIVEGHEYERITARLQTDINISENVKVGYSGIFYNYASEDIPGGIFYQAYVAPPIMRVYKLNGFYGDPADIDVGNFANPQASLDWFNQESGGQQLTSNVFGEVKFLENFTFRSSLGLNYGINEFRNYVSEDSLTTVQKALRSRLTKSRSKMSSWLVENTLTYDNTFGDHEVTALLGTSAQENRSEAFSGSASDVPFESEGNLYLSLGDPETFSISNTGDKFSFLSYFGRLNYSFKNRYLFTGTLRYDASSKFPADERWDYFPSIGVGWIVTEEPFMSTQTILNNLKLRASWGKLGNEGIPTNIFTQTVNNNPRYSAIFGGIPYLGRNITTLVPPTLLWEVVNETDIGVEMAFLNFRLTVEADWYNKETKDAIFDAPVLGTLGTSNSFIRGNYADFRNTGFEFVMNWQDEVGTDFSYDIGINFSTNRNEVTELATGNTELFAGGVVDGNLASVSRVGDPIGSFYGYVVDGIFQTEADVEGSAQPLAEPGDFMFRDQNGDGVIDAGDKVVLGNPNPGYYYGINTGFRFMGFDLQLDIQGVADVDIYNANRNIRFGNENYDADFFENRWLGPGTSNTYPSADLSGSNLNINSWYVEKGDYIRIRNLQLGYNLPTDLVNEWRMQSARIFLNAQNPVTLFDYNGFSPEIGGSPLSAGLDNNVYPLSATYNLGVNVTF